MTHGVARTLSLSGGDDFAGEGQPKEGATPRAFSPPPGQGTLAK